jgi:hypothetical protein
MRQTVRESPMVLNVQDLPRGVYAVTLTNNDLSTTHRLLLK